MQPPRIKDVWNFRTRVSSISVTKATWWTSIQHFSNYFGSKNIFIASWFLLSSKVTSILFISRLPISPQEIVWIESGNKSHLRILKWGKAEIASKSGQHNWSNRASPAFENDRIALARGCTQSFIVSNIIGTNKRKLRVLRNKSVRTANHTTPDEDATGWSQANINAIRWFHLLKEGRWL